MNTGVSTVPVFPFSDVILIQNKIYGDARGFFMESYNEKYFREATGLNLRFVQDNHTRSNRGVLRGVHYQLPPHAQGKFIRVTNGAVYDIFVDLRKNSPTFGKWAGITLRDSDGKSLWIPPGFGHGFLVLEDGTDFLYKTTDFYSPQSERAIAWNDPEIGIQWPLDLTGTPLLSAKDAKAPQLSVAKVFE